MRETVLQNLKPALARLTSPAAGAQKLLADPRNVWAARNDLTLLAVRESD
jgi:hypothetical protein